MKYIIVLFILTMSSGFSLSGQELLKASRIQGRAVRRNLPELGLPKRNTEEIDPTIWYKDRCWYGADSLKATPFWITETIDRESVVKTKLPSAIVSFCNDWVGIYQQFCSIFQVINHVLQNLTGRKQWLNVF